MRRRAHVSIVAAFLAVALASPVHSQGAVVVANASRKRSPTKQSAAAAESANATDAAFYRAVQGASPFVRDGKPRTTLRPRKRWSIELGAPITAAPVIGQDQDGHRFIWLGAHNGRYVAVASEGASAGTILQEWVIPGIIWAAPASDGGKRSYVGVDNDTIYAFELGRAEPIWARKLGDCADARAPGPQGWRCDLDGAPLVLPSGDILVGGDGLFRLSANGDIEWRWPASPRKHAHVSTAPIFTHDHRIGFGTSDGRIVVLSDAGELIWEFSVGADVDAAPVVMPNGNLCIGSDDGRLYCVDHEGALDWVFLTPAEIRGAIGYLERPSATMLVSSYDGSLYALSQNGVLRWRRKTKGEFHAQPVVDSLGRVYLGGRDGYFYVIDGIRGKQLARIPLSTEVDAAAAVMPDGTFIFATDDGVVRAYR